MAWKIAELFVEWTMKGVEGFQKAIDNAQASLAKLKEGANAVGTIANEAFNRLNGTVGGFVRQGLAASAMGDVLNFQLQRLALSIAGLFGPELQKLISLVQQFTNYLNSLSNEQRAHIAHLIEGAAAGLFVASVMPRLLGAIQGIIGGVKALSAAFLGLDVATGGILPLIGALVAAFTGIAVGTEVGRGALSDLFETIKPVLDVLKTAFDGLMESLGPLFSAVTELVSAFMPIIEAVIEVGSAILSVLIPAITALVELLSPLIKLLGFVAQIVSGVLVPVFKVLAGIVTAVAKAIAFITGRKFEPEDKTKEAAKTEQRGSLVRKSPGPEGLGAAFDRIAKASIAVGLGGAAGGGVAGKSPEERQVDQQAETNKKLDLIHQDLRRAHPFLIGA